MEAVIDIGSTKHAEQYFKRKQGVEDVRIHTDFQTVTITVSDYVAFAIPLTIR